MTEAMALQPKANELVIVNQPSDSEPEVNNMQLVECNPSSNDEIIAQIHLWIFEHSLKFGMRNVTKSVLSKYQIYACINSIIGSWQTDGILDEAAPVNPDILFLYLVEKLKRSIIKLAEENKDPTKQPDIDIDFELLNLVVDLIENIYRQSQLMAFHTFACLIARLKLMELVCRIAKQEHEQIIMRRLDILFPKWTMKYEEYITSKIRVPDAKSLNKLSSSHSKIRRYILELLSSNEKQRTYLQNSFANDINDILQYTSKHLEAFPKFSEGKLPPTAIEQLLNGAYHKTGIDNEPAIRILLDNLTTESKTQDFLNVLDMLSPDSHVSLRDCFDEFSDSDSERGLLNDNGMIIYEPPTPVENASQAFAELCDGNDDLFLPQSANYKEPKAKKSTNNSVVIKKKPGGKKSVSPTSDNNEASVCRETQSSNDDLVLSVRRRLCTNSAKNTNNLSDILSAQANISSSNIINASNEPTRKRKNYELYNLGTWAPAPQSVKLKRCESGPAPNSVKEKRESRPAPKSVKEERKKNGSKTGKKQRVYIT